MQKLILGSQRHERQRGTGTSETRLQKTMLANGRRRADCKPVVKLFTPWGGAAWLLTELDPTNPDLAFGLCDTGQGYPELGQVSLSEISALRGPGGLRVERDAWFTANKTLAAYAAEAQARGCLVA